jgi:hypothetical protein
MALQSARRRRSGAEHAAARTHGRARCVKLKLRNLGSGESGRVLLAGAGVFCAPAAVTCVHKIVSRCWIPCGGVLLTRRVRFHCGLQTHGDVITHASGGREARAAGAQRAPQELRCVCDACRSASGVAAAVSALSRCAQRGLCHCARGFPRRVAASHARRVVPRRSYDVSGPARRARLAGAWLRRARCLDVRCGVDVVSRRMVTVAWRALSGPSAGLVTCRPTSSRRCVTSTTSKCARCRRSTRTK